MYISFYRITDIIRSSEHCSEMAIIIVIKYYPSSLFNIFFTLPYLVWGCQYLFCNQHYMILPCIQMSTFVSFHTFRVWPYFVSGCPSLFCNLIGIANFSDSFLCSSNDWFQLFSNRDSLSPILHKLTCKNWLPRNSDDFHMHIHAALP